MLLPIYIIIIFILLFKTEWLLKISDWNNIVLRKAEPCRITSVLRKLNYQMIWEYVIIGFLVLVCFNGTRVPDFTNYAEAFRRMSLGIPYSYLGKGWYLLMNIGFTLGFDYQFVKALVAMIALLLINSSLNFYCKTFKGRMFFWGIFLIFPALLDITQIRFFAASSLVVYGFRYLKQYSLRNLTSYILIVAIGSLIHSSVIFYGLLAFVYLFPYFPKIYAGLLLTISFSGLLLKDYLILVASGVIESDRLERYFTSGDSMGIMGLIFAIAFIIVQLAILVLCLREYKLNSDKAPQFIQDLNLGSGVATTLLVIVPLCRLDANFFRLERPGWLLFVMILSSLLFERRRTFLDKNRNVLLKWIIITMAFSANLYLISLFTFQIISGYLL
ncbi:EpsG family protein [Ileibacterium valens]|uniref:EpsG family protein n=1 Tax=Ileibacterium valens TaxID=1862668 RepID=UPI003516332D